MGITIESARFDGRSPDLDRIVAEMTRRSGLAVSVRDSTPEVKGDAFDLHCSLAFACEPRESVKVLSYQPGTSRGILDALAKEVASDPVAVGHVGKILDGLGVVDDRDDHRQVILQGHVGEEGTLFGVAELALESLGGSLRAPMSDARRRACSGPLDPSTLRARHRAHYRAMRKAVIGAFGQAAVSSARRVWGWFRRRS